MSAKDNLNEAMFSVFGVGKDPAETAAAPLPLAEDPVVPHVYAPRTTQQAGTYLAPGTVMEGKLQTTGDVEIAGYFTGDITSEGKVTLRSNLQGNVTAVNLQLFGCRLVGDIHASGVVVLDERSAVAGNIRAGELFCSGVIKGDLYVHGNLSLSEKAVVEGNITTTTMTMARGAMISGNLKMNRAERQPAEDGGQKAVPSKEA